MIADAVVARSTLEALLDPRELVTEIIEAIQERHPPYTRFDTLADEGAWAHTVAYLLGLFLDLAAENRRLTADESARIRRIGAVRVQQDLDCATVRGAVRTAASVVRARILDACRRPETEDVPFDSLLALLDAFAHEVEDVLSDARAHGSDRRPGADARLRLLRDAVNRNISASELERRAAEQGCEPLVQRSVVVAADEAALEGMASEFHDSCVVRARSGRCGSYAVLLMAHRRGDSDEARRLDRLARAAGTKVLLIGPSASVGDLYDRYLCASAVLPYLAELGGDQFVIPDREVELLALVAALPRDVRQALVRHLLERPLDACDQGTRTRMLDCLEQEVRFGFKVLMIQRATQADRKTVYKRRATLSEIVGRSSSSSDRSLLTVAHYARAIEESTRPVRRL